jgi:molybdate transport system permease protein
MNEEYLFPLWISLRTVGVATVITFIAGVAAARWMARYSGRHSGRMEGLIDGLFLLPMVLPPTVVGLGLLLLFGKHGPLGAFLARFNTTVIFSWQATVIAAAVMAFPIMYMTARGAFEQVDPSIEDAARTLGASEWRLFWTVTMPLAWPGVAAATVLSLARALGEFGATLMLAGNIPGKTATIPVAIYFAIQAGDMDRALILVAIVMVIAFASLAAVAFWKTRTPRARDAVPMHEGID